MKIPIRGLPSKTRILSASGPKNAERERLF